MYAVTLSPTEIERGGTSVATVEVPAAVPDDSGDIVVKDPATGEVKATGSLTILGEPEETVGVAGETTDLVVSAEGFADPVAIVKTADKTFEIQHSG